MNKYPSLADKQFLMALPVFFKYDPDSGEIGIRGCVVGVSVRGGAKDVTLRASGRSIEGMYAAVILKTGMDISEFSVRRINKGAGDNRWANLEVYSRQVARPHFADIPSELTPDTTSIIYSYTHRTNGLKYIGRTINPESRMKDHICSALNPKTKFSKALAEHGVNAFDYRVLKVCHVDTMRYWEAYYIDRYEAVKTGYNTAKVKYRMERVH